LLTTRRQASEGLGGRDGAAEEIDADGCGRGAPAAGRFGERRRSSRHGILVRAVRTAREDVRKPRRCSPVTRSSGRPSIARRRDSLVVARVGVRRGCGSSIGGGSCRGPRGGFIEREGERGGDGQAIGHQYHASAGGFKAIKGGLNEEETEGVLRRGRHRGLIAP
jgi:hypothetical protein